MKIAVIGAGIGGLSVALALQKVGLPATVYEQAPALASVGAGIGLWPGALRSLREVGVADWFWDLPVCPFRWASTSTTGGRQLIGFDVTAVTGGLGYVVRRTDLQAAMLDSLRTPVEVGRRLADLRQVGSEVRLTFDDGTTVAADLVIGADGLHSRVREVVLGMTPARYSGETAYRGMADFAMADPGLMQEMQGSGVRGAVHAIDAGHVYWWATRRAPAGLQETAEQRKDIVSELVAGWASELPDAVASTPAAEILRNDIHDRQPVAKWSAGRLTLLGDAAHPTTPNLGLGGCMAIEDALVLARALRADPSPAAFVDYERQRHRRTAGVVMASRWMGALGSIANPRAEAAWQAATRLTPDRIGAALLARQVTYQPGPLLV